MDPKGLPLTLTAVKSGLHPCFLHPVFWRWGWLLIWGQSVCVPGSLLAGASTPMAPWVEILALAGLLPWGCGMGRLGPLIKSAPSGGSRAWVPILSWCWEGWPLPRLAACCLWLSGTPALWLWALHRVLHQVLPLPPAGLDPWFSSRCVTSGLQHFWGRCTVFDCLPLAPRGLYCILWPSLSNMLHEKCSYTEFHNFSNCSFSLSYTHTDIHRSKIVFLFVYYPFCISDAVCFLFCDFLVNEVDKHVVYKYHTVSYVNLP